MNSIPPAADPKSGLAARAGDPVRNDQPKGLFSGPIKQAVLKDWVASGKATTIRVSGNSMWPFLRDRDTVTVKPCSRAVRLGDIAVYFAGEVLLIHRVVKVRRSREGAELRTKGDFALGCDPAVVKEADLLGRAVAVTRGKTHIDLESASLRACGSAAALFSYLTGITLGRLRGAPRTHR